MRKGWEYKKLGEVLETTSGGTPSKSHKEYYEGGTIPWLRSGEVSKGDIYDAELYITEEGLKKSSAKLFPIDTVLIAMYGATVGQVGILKSTMCTNQAICGILPNKDFHPNFLKYVLLANKKNYLKQAIGGAQPNISQQVIKSTYIPIVKFSEQESVVSELDKINELIRLKKEQLKDFDNLAQSLFYEMFGDPVENEMGWEVKKLGEVYKMKSGDSLSTKSFEEGDIPVYGGNGISGYHNQYNKDGSYIIIGRVGVYCGNVRIVKGRFWLTDNAFELLYDNSSQNEVFVCSLLTHLNLRQYANAAAQPVISNNTLKHVSIPLPPLPLQQLFAHRIEQIEHQKAEVQKSITDLETLLASRMQYWFE